MTLFLVVIHFVIDCGAQKANNVIDRCIIDKLQIIVRIIMQRRIGRGSHKQWGRALQRGVLMFSDLQIVTGIAILAAGYSQLHCGLSSYHWEMVIDLAWFASLTHLATLTILYQYFRDNPRERNWRAFFMLVIVGMLGVALVPTGNSSWGANRNMAVPAQCFFEALADVQGSDSYSDPTMTTSLMISLTILVISYVTRIIKFSKKSSDFMRRWLRSKPGHLLKKWLDGLYFRSRRSRVGCLYRIGYQLLLAEFVLLKALFDIYESMSWEVRENACSW